MALVNPEQLFAGAIKYLIQGDEQEAASLLLQCNVEYGRETFAEELQLPLLGKSPHLCFALTGPRSVYDVMEIDG